MRIAAFLVPALFVAGCATNRSNTADYELMSSGKVPATSVASFRQCVNDSFKDRTMGLGLVLLNRMQVREGMWRIEYVNNEVGPMLSADIMDDGRYELYEITYPSRFRVRGERDAFNACAKSNGQNKG